jgi:hypothetical protein
MRRKLSITVVIFFSAFMLNVSAMSFQQRYDRREDEQDFDPNIIEMTDMQVFKFLKNTYFFDLPINLEEETREVNFVNDNLGFGNQYTITFKPFLSCQLKFLMMEYIGFFADKKPDKTYYFYPKSG